MIQKADASLRCVGTIRKDYSAQLFIWNYCRRLYCDGLFEVENSFDICGWGSRAFLRWWPPSAIWGGPLIFMATTGDVWIIPSFQIWGNVLHVEHVSCVITNCGQHLRHPFSFLNSTSGHAGEKHYQKITIPIFRLVLQNFAIPGYFPYILFYGYLFSLLASDLFVIAVCDSAWVRELVKS